MAKILTDYRAGRDLAALGVVLVERAGFGRLVVTLEDGREHRGDTYPQRMQRTLIALADHLGPF